MRNNHIKIDVTAIPDYLRDSLADATLEFTRDLLNNPGAREMLDKKRAAMQADDRAPEASQSKEFRTSD